MTELALPAEQNLIEHAALLTVVTPLVLLLANRVIRPAVEVQRYADDILEHGVSSR